LEEGNGLYSTLSDVMRILGTTALEIRAVRETPVQPNAFSQQN
jgi:hypothetical protein